MPYVIVKSNRKGIKGYRVRKKEKEPNGKYKYLSKKPLPKKKAVKQRIAVILSEKKKQS